MRYFVLIVLSTLLFSCTTRKVSPRLSLEKIGENERIVYGKFEGLPTVSASCALGYHAFRGSKKFLPIKRKKHKYTEGYFIDIIQLGNVTPKYVKIKYKDKSKTTITIKIPILDHQIDPASPFIYLGTINVAGVSESIGAGPLGSDNFPSDAEDFTSENDKDSTDAVFTPYYVSLDFSKAEYHPLTFQPSTIEAKRVEKPEDNYYHMDYYHMRQPIPRPGY